MVVNTILSNSPNHASIQIQSGAQFGQRSSIPCEFHGVDGKRAELESRDRVPVSSAITVEYNDTMLLGEVMACTRTVGDTWRVEMKVEQILTGLQSLMTLRARLLGEPVPEFSFAGAGCR
jgi:hypothetical protein